MYVYICFTHYVHRRVLIQKLPTCSLQRAAIADATDSEMNVNYSRPFRSMEKTVRKEKSGE